MYLPKRYAEENPEAIDALIQGNGFATMVTSADGEPLATHLPMELVRDTTGRRVLEGHVSRANPHWRTLEAGARVLCIFGGPHTYISPTWYDHENVPTWNYMVVHIWGTAQLVEDPADVRALLTRLSRRYEDTPGGFAVDRMTPEYYAKEVRGIVAFRIKVERVEAAFKLSQNRNATDHANIVRQLEARGDEPSRGVARAMRDRPPS